VLYWLSCISVRAKLALLVSMLALGTVAVSGMALFTLDWSASAMRQIVTSDVVVVRGLGEMRAAVGNMRRFEKDLFLNLGDEAELARYHKSWGKEAGAALERLQSLGTHLQSAERDSAARMAEGIRQYRQAVEGIVGEIKVGKINDPWRANQAMEPHKSAIRAADKAFEEITGSVMARIDERAAELERVDRRAMTAVAVTAVASLLLGIALALAVARRITHPLAEAVRAVERVAAGDLGSRPAVPGRDETARVLSGIAAMQDALAQVVGRIRQGVQSVNVASTEIAQGNGDLSSRTERQAASLQQTAASIEQLGIAARESAEHAGHIHTMVQQASTVADEGGRLVRDVVSTMAQIGESGARIAEINAVIDGIAFQTNILALNAAVEAARAGEQGRGFAVVAAEVRALAQRSGEAARQIKALIGESVTRVEGGQQVVRRAGDTIDEVVRRVQAMRDTVERIAAAAAQQSEGIGEVSRVVGALDQATQQNAALVEQTAAASESLRQQAQRLSGAVAHFRVEPAEAPAA